MDWDDVKVFLAIARAGSLGGAARQAGSSQPTMGRRLRALEAEVGQALFQRGSEGFVLTDAGQAVLAHSERMEEEALGFQRRLSGQDSHLQGLLRVSSSDWFGVYMLSPVFAGFMRRHPAVSIELVTDARLFNLARREADLVFRIRPFDEAEVVQRRLMRLDYRLYGATGQAQALADGGKGLSLITLDTALSDFPDAVWLRRQFPNARIGFGSNSREAQARMCAAGAGVAVLPILLAATVPGLTPIDLSTPPPSRDVWIGFHRDLRRLGRLRALVDAAVDQLAN